MYWIRRVVLLIAAFIIGFLVSHFLLSQFLVADVQAPESGETFGSIIDSIGFESGDTLTASLYYNQLKWTARINYNYIHGGHVREDFDLIGEPDDARLVLAGRYAHIILSFSPEWYAYRFTMELPEDAPIYRPLCTNVYIPSVEK